jgi:hypothetical protein
MKKFGYILAERGVISKRRLAYELLFHWNEVYYV